MGKTISLLFDITIANATGIIVGKTISLLFDMAVQFWYVWLIVLICVFINIFKPKIKGFFGEKSISAILSFLPKENYKILNDIMLKTQHGTTQIDHIVVSNYGIFVIETKNYKGWIFGKEKDEYWVQNIYGKKNKFKNPLRQNYGHTQAIKELLSDIENILIVPIVAFSNECDLKIKVTSHVVYFAQINKVIKKYSENKFTKEQVNSIYNRIINSNVNNKENSKQHIFNIKEQIKTNESAIENGLCPKCGGNLVDRKGSYGYFKGCSNYPKCKYILK